MVLGVLVIAREEIEGCHVMLNQKFILIFLLFFVLLSFSFLAISESRQHQLESGWFLYFDNTSNQSLNFTIENYSDNPNFTWEISTDKKSLGKRNIQVLKGTQESVMINEPLERGRIKITVYQAKETKEIYKNFE